MVGKRVVYKTKGMMYDGDYWNKPIIHAGTVLKCKHEDFGQGKGLEDFYILNVDGEVCNIQVEQDKVIDQERVLELFN